MKSKQALAKEAQNYRKTPVNCGTCKHYESEFIHHPCGAWTEEKNKRCGIGGFAVMKRAVCDKWELNPKFAKK